MSWRVEERKHGLEVQRTMTKYYLYLSGFMALLIILDLVGIIKDDGDGFFNVVVALFGAGLGGLFQRFVNPQL